MDQTQLGLVGDTPNPVPLPGPPALASPRKPLQPVLETTVVYVPSDQTVLGKQSPEILGLSLSHELGKGVRPHIRPSPVHAAAGLRNAG